MATEKKTKPTKLTARVLILWREQMGFTQNDAAEALGCSKRSIVNWENGHNDIPRYIGLAMKALHMEMKPLGRNGDDD